MPAFNRRVAAQSLRHVAKRLTLSDICPDPSREPNGKDFNSEDGLSAILLTWNPDKWNWRQLSRQIKECKAQGYVDEPWSCSQRKNVAVGTRVFLMKLGGGLPRHEKGLIASGRTRSVPEPDPHWDEEQAEAGVYTNYVDVRFDYLSREPVVALDELESRLGKMAWTPQRSGNDIPEDILSKLEEEWEKRATGGIPFHLPDEVEVHGNFSEGSVRQVIVNVYERDRRARAACLKHFGCACAICGFSFEAEYGEIAAGFTHVHHVVPLSEVGKTYKVDPIKDLIPLCPNCHAVIHMSSPCMSVNEMKDLVKH